MSDDKSSDIASGRTPPPYDTTEEALERDTDIEFMKASGPGGQHRNKRETGVRLRHRPSGLVAQATERRSQAQNRSVAFDRLVALLEELNAPPPAERVPTKPSRAQKAERLQEKTQRSQVKRTRRFRPEPE